MSLNPFQATPHATVRNSITSRRTVTVFREFGPEQYRILRCGRRFIVVAAGRRFGKTTVVVAMLVFHAAKPRQLCYYIAPTQRQAKEMAWYLLKEMLPPYLCGV